MIAKTLLVDRKVPTSLPEAEALDKVREWARGLRFTASAPGQYMRGKKLASWLSMSIEDLHTTLTVAYEPGAVKIHYDVHVQGQYLNDVDYRLVEVEVKELEAALNAQPAPSDRHEFKLWRAKFFYGSFIVASLAGLAAAVTAMEMRDLFWWQAGLVHAAGLAVVWAPILIWGGSAKIQPGYLTIEKR